MAESCDRLSSKFNDSSEVGFPNITAGDETERENQVGRLDGHDSALELSGLTVQVNLKTSNRKLRNEVEVGVEATEVGGQQELRRILDKFGIGGPILRSIRSSFIENEDWLVDLDPLDARSLEFGKELLVDVDEFGKQGEGIKVCRSLPSRFAKEKVRERTENDGPRLDSKSLCFVVLGERLVVKELEISVFGELGYNIVVIGVEPVQKW